MLTVLLVGAGGLASGAVLAKGMPSHASVGRQIPAALAVGGLTAALVSSALLLAGPEPLEGFAERLPASLTAALLLAAAVVPFGAAVEGREVRDPSAPVEVALLGALAVAGGVLAVLCGLDLALAAIGGLGWVLLPFALALRIRGVGPAAAVVLAFTAVGLAAAAVESTLGLSAAAVITARVALLLPVLIPMVASRPRRGPIADWSGLAKFGCTVAAIVVVLAGAVFGVAQGTPLPLALVALAAAVPSLGAWALGRYSSSSRRA